MRILEKKMGDRKPKTARPRPSSLSGEAGGDRQPDLELNMPSLKSDDSYRTISSSGAGEIKVLGSRFIARAIPVNSGMEAEEVLSRLRREFHDATHHCFAYRLGTQGDQFRFSDDGEPNGTAGRPILGAIQKNGLTNVLVVVIRSFGGTKLGTGGLSRAYADSAQLALGKGMVQVCYETDSIRVTFPHDQTGNVMHVVSKERVRIVDTQYDEEVHLLLTIRKSMTLAFKEELEKVTRGNVRIQG